MVPIQMHREANFILPWKDQTSMYNNYFSNFGRPLVSDDWCKDTAPRLLWFWRRRFLNVFNIYGHGGHLGQRTATVLAIFYPPPPPPPPPQTQQPKRALYEIYAKLAQRLQKRSRLKMLTRWAKKSGTCLSWPIWQRLFSRSLIWML